MTYSVANYACRGCLLTYAVLAFVSIPFTLRLMSTSTEVLWNSETREVTMPLTVCMPSNLDAFDMDGSKISMEYDYADGGSKCKGTGVLVFATAVSTGISAFASLIYLYKDVRAIMAKGTLNMSFLLLQSGLVSASLITEVNFWKHSYQLYYDSLGSLGVGGEVSVRFPSSMVLATAACAFAFISLAALALRKCFLVQCERARGQAPVTKAVATSVSTKDEECSAEPVTPNASGGPSWTKV